MPTGTFIEGRKENACSLVRDQSVLLPSSGGLGPQEKAKRKGMA